jgi:two-component system cell cycle response regulator
VRILIADDEATSRLVLAGVLRKFGHEVSVAEDGTAAWEAMRRPDAPALAVLDWMMPGLTGPEVCRLVRTLPSDEPPYLILLTSLAEKADVVAGLEAGADDYLAKPFDPGELRARVDVGRRFTELQKRLREARDALAEAAMHDPLTGALNRRALDETLARAISAERRHHAGLALGICDIDEFKKVNDAHGHQVGDQVLCELVARLSTGVRGHDVVSRFGGDEFVVLMEQLGQAGPQSAYERLRRSVADRPMPTTAGELPVTISIGVSIWRDDVTAVQLLAGADDALYLAKRAGRNRVVVFRDPPLKKPRGD